LAVGDRCTNDPLSCRSSARTDGRQTLSHIDLCVKKQISNRMTF
jgi:hypothetical protein